MMNYEEDVKETIIVKNDKDSAITLPTNYEKGDIIKIIGLNHKFEVKIKKREAIVMQDYCNRHIEEIIVGQGILESKKDNDTLYLCYIDKGEWLGEWQKNCS